MSIVFDPAKMIRKIAPKAKIERLLRGNVSLKKTALNFLSDVEFVDKKAVTKVALKTIKGYKKRVGLDKEIKSQILDDPKLLINRVQNEIVFQMHEKIVEQYNGQKARWLPSSAVEPRPEHQLNYGKEYIIGEGINGVEPGDEYGCQCGVEILTNETSLKLD